MRSCYPAELGTPVHHEDAEVNWEKFDLHLENLIPGIVLLSAVVAGWSVDPGPLEGQAALLAISFVACSYMLGAVGNVGARFLLDDVSKVALRPPLLQLFAKDRLDDKTKWANINKQYVDEIAKTLRGPDERIAAEVSKRRQTGRILRSALCPICIVLFVMASHAQWPWWVTAVAALCSYIVLLLLYGYAEVAIFHEATLAKRSPKEPSPKTK